MYTVHNLQRGAELCICDIYGASTGHLPLSCTDYATVTSNVPLSMQIMQWPMPMVGCINIGSYAAMMSTAPRPRLSERAPRNTDKYTTRRGLSAVTGRCTVVRSANRIGLGLVRESAIALVRCSDTLNTEIQYKPFMYVKLATSHGRDIFDHTHGHSNQLTAQSI